MHYFKKFPQKEVMSTLTELKDETGNRLYDHKDLEILRRSYNKIIYYEEAKYSSFESVQDFCKYMQSRHEKHKQATKINKKILHKTITQEKNRNTKVPKAPKVKITKTDKSIEKP